MNILSLTCRVCGQPRALRAEIYPGESCSQCRREYRRKYMRGYRMARKAAYPTDGSQPATETGTSVATPSHAANGPSAKCSTRTAVGATNSGPARLPASPRGKRRQKKPTVKTLALMELRDLREARKAKELRRLIRREAEMRRREILKAEIEQIRWRA